MTDWEDNQTDNEAFDMTIEEALIPKYGPILSFANQAEILHRSPDALRITPRSSNESR